MPGGWLAVPLWRALRARASLRASFVLVGGLVLSFLTAAIAIQLAVSSRHSLAGAAPMAGAPPGSPAAQSMQVAVAGLEARLARGGGSDSDWELLAKAYDFLGRPDDASRARAHLASPQAPPPGGAVNTLSVEALVAAANAAASGTSSSPAPRPPVATAPAAATLEELQRQVREHPDDSSAWLALADLHRARHEERAARDALAKVVALNAMTAQSWADYADVLAALAGGSLGGSAGRAIDQALLLDPGNPKALWLKASQAHEEHRFTGALTYWRRLRAVLPGDSPDLRIVDANIAEDTELGGRAPAAATSVVGVSGTVTVDSRLAGRVPPEATLFIYARAADAPGPPLAVLRTTAGAWPVRFRLDDSMAMIPTRRLSQFDKVVIEARISRSGQAAPSQGDLFVTSPVVSPTAGKELELIINREIG